MEVLFGNWYPLDQLKRENQKILIWMNDGVHMAIAYKPDYPYFWDRVKAWMPFPYPPGQ